MQNEIQSALDTIYTAIDALTVIIDDVIPQAKLDAAWWADAESLESRDSFGSYEDQHRLRSWELI